MSPAFRAFRTVVALPLLACAAGVNADDTIVGTGTPASCTETAVNAAINALYPGASFPGGVMSFNCGVNPHTIAITSSKGLSQGTLIDGGGRITFDAQDLTRHFTVQGAQSQVELRGLSLVRGRAVSGFGGSVSVAAGTSLTIKGCIFDQNNADFSGGAIATEPSAVLSISDSTFSLNRAQHGGAIAANGAVSALRSTFSENRATVDQGGAIQIWFANLSVIDSRFEFNTATNGGALLLRSGVHSIANTNFESNSAVERGGGMHLYEGASVATGDQLSFTGNQAADGGAMNLGGLDTGPSPTIPAFGSRASIQRSYFDENSSTSTGGAITVFGPAPGNGGSFGQLVMSVAQFTRNTSILGGAIWSQGQIGGVDLSFERNVAVRGGAMLLDETYDSGVAFLVGTTDLRRTTFHANTASFQGGAIHASSALPFFTGVNFIGNSAQYGGGMAVRFFNLPIRNASFIDNRASIRGGGIYVENSSALELDNLTFSGNRALDAAAQGGDIFAGTYSTSVQTSLHISHSTMFGGSAPSGSAIYAHGKATAISLRNSVLLGSGVDTCAGNGLFQSQDGNFMPGDCNPMQPNDVPIASANALNLSGLTNNGTYLLAHVPNAGSALIDHVPCPPQHDLDQRGRSAPIDGDGNGIALCDSGSIERQLSELPAAYVLHADGFE
ncbi:MAG: hypothetical protein SGI99_03360 [Pseudomonadota bacterium]|nr:hypothetical protein [Pseudomonadota bacterium]